MELLEVLGFIWGGPSWCLPHILAAPPKPVAFTSTTLSNQPSHGLGCKACIQLQWLTTCSSEFPRALVWPIFHSMSPSLLENG